MVRQAQLPVANERIATLRQRIVGDEPLVHALVMTGLMLMFTILMLMTRI